jgi:competence protein ComEA
MRARVVPYLIGLLSGLLAGGILWLLLSPPRGTLVTLLPPPSPVPLRVHVIGAVHQPGVVELPPGALVEQAIQAAGGPAEGANLAAVNLAARLEDGDQVRVPLAAPTALTPDASTPPAVASTPVPPGSPVNLNTASAPELDRLPGIGPSLAKEIIAYREAHGAFARVEDLLLVPGIGPAKLASLRDLVSVD